MRVIKFRAMKDDMNTKWVYGNLTYSQEGYPRIHPMGVDKHTTCLRKTEGQYTGLIDKNGKDIYCGDVVKHKYDDEPTVVEYKTHLGGLYHGDSCLARADEEKIEVIGDIHMTPELVEEK